MYNDKYYKKSNYTHELITLMKNDVKSNIDSLLKFILDMKKNKALNKVDYLGLTVSEIRELDSVLNNEDKRKLKNARIYLYLSNPTQLLFDEYKHFLSSFNIYSVVVNGLTNVYATDNDEFAKTLDSKMWYEYLKNIKKLTANINQNVMEKDPDREKKIFCILSSRIIESVTYDLNPNVSYEFNKRKKYHSENAPDEIVGMVEGNCVCRGYAGIVRDTCMSLNIDSIVIKGNNDEGAHAWNQVKLDGIWYNVDLTWDNKAILDNGNLYWILKSNFDFNKYGIYINDKLICHSSYNYNRSKNEHMCFESIPIEFIKKYLYLEKLQKQNWLKSIVDKINNLNERSVKK